MITGDLDYDLMRKWLRLFEDDLIKLIDQEAPRSHEDACRYIIKTIQAKLHEYDRLN
jgi:hypothetical protein